MGPTIEFSDDEQGYREWLSRNPDGFVVNQRWGTYLRVHRSCCIHIRQPEMKHTNSDAKSTKVCDGDLAILKTWVKARYGREPDPCRACKP
jgi:hypothetical protein